MKKYKEGKYIVKEWLWGEKEWYLNDVLHREDGPACEYPNGGGEWWLGGIEYSEHEWKLEMRKRKMELLGLC